jgi:Ca-activated chloride channel family protein
MPFGLSFTNPLALLLFPPLALYFVWLARRSLADLSPARRNLAVGIRLLVLSLLVFALAGLQFVRFNNDVATMFVLDYSDSIPPATKEAALGFIQKAVKEKRQNDQAGVVVFGRDAYIELAPSMSKDVGKIQTVTSSEFTDIAAAVRLGMASLPDGAQKRLVVLSDGNENLGNALEEALSAASNDIAIDVVPLTSPQRREALLERLTMPSEAKIGEPVEVKVVARATQTVDGQIKLFRDGKLLGNRLVRINAGKNVFTFPQTVTDAGAATFEARLETNKGDDTNPENNRALGFVNVQGKPRVLVVSNEPNLTRFLTGALAKEKVNVELRGPGGLPSDLRGMQPYDAIVLDNVPAWDMSARQMLSLQSYVRDLGCGLVMVGGESSYGPGGYRSTPIEETLPVSMDLKQMQYIPGGAVSMIMHSMEFPDGNEWAKSVCQQVTRQLGDNDYAGLVIFGMDATQVYKGGMLKVGPNRNYMLTEIRKINPGDMPDFDAALNVAYDGLIKTNAYLKHCIILSDGDPSPPAPALVAKFNAARITVSTVVINPHDRSGSQSMWNIARQHGGRFYEVRNAKEIPNIFLKEAATISRSAIIEGAFTPKVNAESSILKGINSTPPLLGYVGTSAKTTSREILKSKDDDPILATWQYGLGKSVAWTSDARQRWSAGWLPWSGYSKFWAQAVRWSMRGSTSGDLQTNVTIDRGRGKVTIEAVDEKGNFLNFLSPKARLVPPDYKGRDLALDQVGPGRYEADFDARQLGTYLVNIRTQRGDKVSSQITGGVLPYSPEYGAIGTDTYLLNGLAERSQGKMIPITSPKSIFDRLRTPARVPVDLWLVLLMIAACLFPLDVAVRRLIIGEDELNNFSNLLRRRKGTPKEEKTVRSESTERLARAKKASQTGISNRDTSSARTETPPAVPPRPVGSAGAPTPSATPNTPAPAPQPEAKPEAADDGLDAMERLRQAKRRARGE